MAAASLITITNALVTFKLTSDTIGTPVEYQCQVTTASIDPTANMNPVDATFCAPAGQSAAATGWTLNLVWYQDWGKTESLSQFLFDNEPASVDFEIDGLVVGDAGATKMVASGSADIVPGAYGGAAGVPLTATAALPIHGKPTIAAGTTTATARVPAATGS